MYDDEDSKWVDHPRADNAQDDIDSMIAMLRPFYDGKSPWTSSETGRDLTFWEMLVRCIPENMS